MSYTPEELDLINKYNDLQKNKKQNEKKVKEELELVEKRKGIFKKKRDDIIMHLDKTYKSISEIDKTVATHKTNLLASLDYEKERLCKLISEIDKTVAIYKIDLLTNLDYNKKLFEAQLEDFGEYDDDVCVHTYPTYPNNNLTANIEHRICGICGWVNPQYYFDTSY